MTTRVPLGELLVHAGLLTSAQLSAVLQLQSERGGRLGALLVAERLLSETHVTQILSRQLSVPWVSLAHIDFLPALLKLVPGRLARKHRLVPIVVRSIRKLGDVLYVACEDPSSDDGLREISALTGLRVRPMIATPSDIEQALMRFYQEDSEQAALREKDTVRLNSDGTPKTASDHSPPPVAPAGAVDVADLAITNAAVANPAPTSGGKVRTKRRVPPKKPKAAADAASRLGIVLQLADGRSCTLHPSDVSAFDGAAKGNSSVGEASALPQGQGIDWQGVCSALLELLRQQNVIQGWSVTREN